MLLGSINAQKGCELDDRHIYWPPPAEALIPLVEAMARDSAKAAHELGIEFDMDDPQVAREVMLATFDALFLGGKDNKGKGAGGKSARDTS